MAEDVVCGAYSNSLQREIMESEVINLPNEARLAMVATALVALPGFTASKENVAQIVGSNRTMTLDCGGAGVRIAGSNNKVTLTGSCTKLMIVGSRNSVTVAFGANGSIWLTGSRNEITWATADGKEPNVYHLGHGNTVKRGQ